MAKKLYEESNIQAIADAIREKNGESATYKTSEMADAISAITTGEGGGGIEVEPIVLTGPKGVYACSGELASNYLALFGDTVTTKDLTGSIDNMFLNSTLEYIPFEINCKNTVTIQAQFLFNNANNLKALPKINGLSPTNIRNLCSGCRNLREIPDDYFDNWDFDNTYMANNTSGYSGQCDCMFQNCYSLRKLPLHWISNMNPRIVYSYSFYYNAFDYCHALDEVVGLPVPFTKATWTANALGRTFTNCFRLKNITFKTNEDGTPVVVQWKSQTIDISKNIGYCVDSSTHINYLINYNSGITADKKVGSDISYQKLKDDPDWFSVKPEYSRYNHDSAVATINSLPDASAYLATAGGTNTIKFNGASGSATDGGAINTLTEEEIAVATAKGWTVSLV